MRPISPSRAARRTGGFKGFTLIELLVVVGIIAVLMSILLPSLGRARKQAYAVNCLSNLRQFGTANAMFLSDNKQEMPFANWGATATYPNAKAGWLYEAPVTKFPEVIKTGTFWPYLKSLQIYRCPTHTTDATFGAGVTDKLTSYLMNGGISSTDKTVSAAGVTLKVLNKVNKFKPDDIMMWEADERGGSGWNDGASYPTETYVYDPKAPYALGLAARHGKTAAILRVDGGAEWIEHEEFYRLASDPGRNRVWCDPSTPNGHF